MSPSSTEDDYQSRAAKQRLLDCLRGVDMETIRDHTVWLTDDGQFDYFRSTPWTPVVDSDFVPRPPEELLSDPDYLLSSGALSKDIMIGVNNNEGGYVLDIVLPPSPSASPSPDADTELDKANEVFTAFAAFTALDETMENQALTAELEYRYPELERDERRLALLRTVANFFYLKPTTGQQALTQAIADTFADIYFTFGAVWMAKSLAAAHQRFPQASGGRVFLYLFNHFPVSKAGQPLQGVNHGEDLYYQFDASALFPQDKFDADDFAVQQNFVTMLVDFAKNGNSDTALGRQLGRNWPQYTLSEESYLSLSAQPRVENQMYGKRIALWLDLLPSLYNSTRPKGGYYQQTGGNYPSQSNTWFLNLRGTLYKLWR